MKKRFSFLLVFVAVVLGLWSAVANAQTYNWTPWNYDSGTPPAGAFIAGLEPLPEGGTRQLYICRSRYSQPGFSDGVHPGKIVARYCNIGFGGVEKRQNNYEILTNVNPNRFQWVSASNGFVPAGAVEGGYENNPPRRLFICRTRFAGGTHPGKLIDFTCNITYDGVEVPIRDYEVLVTN